MARSVWLVVAGAVAGATATALYLHGSQSDQSPGSQSGGFGSDAPGPAASFASSLALIETATSAADAAAIEARIARTSAVAPSWYRDNELETLLLRLLETDPRAAIDHAERTGLDYESLARLFQLWAESDPDAAIGGIRTLSAVGARRAAALALLDVFGVDEAATERVAAALPTVEANNFRIDAIGKMAEQDLRGALARALALPSGQAQTAAAQRIAVVMARIAPESALALQDMIAIPVQRIRYRDRLVDEWAKIDPVAVLDYLATSPDLTEVLVGDAGFQALATSAPEKLLAVSDRFAPQQRARAQAAALDVLAALDPAAAFNRVLSLPPSGNRDTFVGLVAEQYAAQDPEGALAWAKSLEPRSPTAMRAVMSGIGSIDPLRAADLVIDEILDPVAANRAEMPSVTEVLSVALQERSPEIALIADRFAAHSDPRVRAQLDSLVLTWPAADPDAAFAWAMRNTQTLTARSASSLAQTLAAANPALAGQSLQALPANLRAAWVAGAANGWAQRDYAGAEDWVLGLPRGEARDGGAEMLVQRAASLGSIDKSLLDAFESDESRARALTAAMFALGSRNPAFGRELIAEYIGDPEQRAIAERQLQSGAERRSAAGGLFSIN